MPNGKTCYPIYPNLIPRQTSQVGDALNYQRYILHSQVVSGACCLIRCWQTVTPTLESGKSKAHGLIHQALHEQTRCDVGKEPSPTVAIIDSQSVKTTELANSRGFDAHKKVKGRKRHIVTDTIGIVLGVKVTDANVSDNQVATELLTEIFSWHNDSISLCRCWVSAN